ncbi:hypothetical protein HaLaN_33024, partial [Haematococcus lacustris]
CPRGPAAPAPGRSQPADRHQHRAAPAAAARRPPGPVSLSQPGPHLCPAGRVQRRLRLRRQPPAQPGGRGLQPGAAGGAGGGRHWLSAGDVSAAALGGAQRGAGGGWGCSGGPGGQGAAPHGRTQHLRLAVHI